MKKTISMILVLALVLTLMPTVLGAEHNMEDIVGHWAEDDVLWVMDRGLFNGISQTAFGPDGSMTRGMFVTVLGRYAGIDPERYDNWYLPHLYTDVDSEQYYAPYINWATRYGITTGMGEGIFGPDQPINREQMATFFVRFADNFGYRFTTIVEEVAEGFADAQTVSGYAVDAVERMRTCGLLTGRPNEDGTFDFDPQALATRAECAAVFHRLCESLVEDEGVRIVEPYDIELAEMETTLAVGDQVKIEYSLRFPESATEEDDDIWGYSLTSEEPEEPTEEETEPSEEPSEPSEEPSEPSEDPSEPSEEPSEPSEDPTEPSEEPEPPVEPVDLRIERITWFSTNPAVAKVDANGVVTALSDGHADIYACTSNGWYDWVEFSVGAYVGYAGESYMSKCENVFGGYVTDHNNPYGPDMPKSVYEENYAYVTVNVWDFSRGIGSEKVTRTRSFYIHKNLELTVRKIFEEIYACEEKYPIYSIGSYWATSMTSEHNPGTALDINSDHNPYMSPDGTILVGKLYDPENNPYSFPVGGEVEQIFAKYGFRRGIYWNSGYKDYMHFSFFGT